MLFNRRTPDYDQSVLNKTLSAAALLLATTAVTANAQIYPARPLRLIVPNGAGGSTDFVARTVSGKLAQALGQQVIVDNRGGSGGIIGTEIVAKSAADGYTLLTGTIGNLAISPHLYRTLPYDPLRDFAPIIQVSAAAYMLLINHGLPPKSLREFIAHAKANPGKMSFASAGSGTGSHLSTVLFMTAAGIQLVHVPYKGAAPALTDLIANQVQIMLNGVTSSLPHVTSGRIRALAVSSPARVSAAADLPTFAEGGLNNAEATSWTGILAPAATPAAVITRLNTELQAILQLPEIRQRLTADGAEPVGGIPSAFRSHLKSELEKWGKVVRATGARAD